MMLIILDKHPVIASGKLAKLTPAKFQFKQVIELAQLVCSAGISNVYKKVPQGKEIQKWILKNPLWTYHFMRELFYSCAYSVDISNTTNIRILQILHDLNTYCNKTRVKGDIALECQTGIWRYKASYISPYPTNTELSVEVTEKLYEDYIMKFKFPRKNKYL